MRHRLTSSLGILLGALLIITIPLQAQQGSISGQVTDQSTGQALAQAQIQVLGGGTSGGALSDAQGNFTVSLDPGSSIRDPGSPMGVPIVSNCTAN